MDGRKEARRRARVLREEFRGRGEFTQQEFRDGLAAMLRDLAEFAFDGFVDRVADEIDKESIQDRDSEEQPAFPGWELDGDYRLGNGRRVAKRHALLHHLEEVMANDEKNVAAVLESSSRKHRELVELRPYFGPGVTKEQAVEAWMADNNQRRGD